jgi:hypothetical protein
MKVAILSESPADEAALRVMVDALVQRGTDVVEGPRFGTRGIHSTLSMIHAFICHLYYQTDAQGLVVVVDSNGCPIFPLEGSLPAGADVGRCRLRRVRKAADNGLRGLRPLAGRAPFGVAVGVAVPAIEAWYLCGQAPDVSEGAWLGVLGSPSMPYTKNLLKQRVYGTDRPSLALETEGAIRHANRVAGDLAALETKFPIGFGNLAREVRAWIK